jgi:hypothetical protein
MKRMLIGTLLLVVVFVGGCGSEDKEEDDPACSGPAVGKWKGDGNSDAVTLGDDEKFAYKGDDGCRTSGTFKCPGNIKKGSVKVTIDVAEASDYCLPSGDYVCPFALSKNALTFYCVGDGGESHARSYKK